MAIMAHVISINYYYYYYYNNSNSNKREKNKKKNPEVHACMDLCACGMDG